MDCPECGANSFYVTEKTYGRIRSHIECCACDKVIQKGQWDKLFWKRKKLKEKGLR